MSSNVVVKNSSDVCLAFCLILSEFDIDLGASVRAVYPKQSVASVVVPEGGTHKTVRKNVCVNVMADSEYFANCMLPDGAEKIEAARTVFMCNRPKISPFARFPCYRFYPQDGKIESNLWQRQAGEEGAPLTAELIVVNRKNANVSLRYKDRSLVEPFEATAANVTALPSLPNTVAPFASRLQACSPAVAPSGASGGGGGGGGASAGANALQAAVYVFVILEHDNTCEGLLMRTVHFRSFVEALTAALEPDTPPLLPLTAFEEMPPFEPLPETTGGEDKTPRPTGIEDASAAPDVAAPAAAAQGEEGGEPTATPQTEGGAPASTGEESSEEKKEEESAPPSPVLETPATTVAAAAAAGAPPIPASQPEPAAPPAVGSQPEKPATPEPPQEFVESPLPVNITSATTAQGQLPHSVAISGAVSPARSVSPTMGGESEGSAHGLKLPEDCFTQGSEYGQKEETGIDNTPLYGLCAVVSKRDNTVRRGGRTKSVAVVGPSLSWLEPFFPLLVEAAYYCIDIPGTDGDAIQQQEQVLKLCFHSINNASGAVSQAMYKTSRLKSEVLRYCTYSGSQQLYVDYRDSPFGTFHRLRIPASPASHDLSFANFNLENLIELFGPSFIQLLKGVLTEKKIVVLTRKGRVTDACEAALALGLIGDMIDGQFLTKKVFPYISVNLVDRILKVPGYIVGTVNPIFENENVIHWDLLCDLDNKTIRVAGERPHKSTSRSLYSALAANLPSFAAGLASSSEAAPEEKQLYNDLISIIYRTRALRMSAHERNRFIRLTIEERLHTLFLYDFVSVANFKKPAALVATHDTPMMQTLRLQCQVTSMAERIGTEVLFEQEPPSLPLLAAAVRRGAKGDDPLSVFPVLQSILRELEEPRNILFFLRRMPQAVGGLDPIGFQLTHPSAAVRETAYALLRRFETIPEGKAAVAAMSNFLVLIYVGRGQ